MRIISKRKLYAYASLSPGFLGAALCWGMPWCSLPPYPQQVAACSELGCKTGGKVNQGSRRKGRALWHSWGSALLLSLPAVLPFKIWNKSLCFSLIVGLCFVPSTFTLISFLFSQYPSPWLQNIEPQGHTVSFFLRFGKKKKKVCLLIHLFLAALGLCCCAWVFSSCGEQGQFHSCGSQASQCGGFSCCRGQALGAWAAAAEALRLSCLEACGIFWEQGLNLCPLNRQADT